MYPIDSIWDFDQRKKKKKELGCKDEREKLLFKSTNFTGLGGACDPCGGSPQCRRSRKNVGSSVQVLHVAIRFPNAKKLRRQRTQLRWEIGNEQLLLIERYRVILIALSFLKVQHNSINKGRCGECGDEWSLPRPRANDEGGLYGTGTIGQTYKTGSVSVLQSAL